MSNPYVDRADLEATTVEQFLADAQASAEAALGPARSLLDSSRGRAVAIDLRDALAAGADLYRALLADRQRIEADEVTKPELLRAEWFDLGKLYNDEARRLRAQIETQSQELVSALEGEAIPVSSDPSAALLARQEVELALRVAPDRTGIQTMMQLAQRGGDIAAAVASEWGRLTFVEKSGNEHGFDAVRTEAIRTALTSEDEGRRRAAAALTALDSPGTGGRGTALYEAKLKTNYALDTGSKLAMRGPIIK